MRFGKLSRKSDFFSSLISLSISRVSPRRLRFPRTFLPTRGGAGLVLGRRGGGPEAPGQRFAELPGPAIGRGVGVERPAVCHFPGVGRALLWDPEPGRHRGADSGVTCPGPWADWAWGARGHLRAERGPPHGRRNP